MLLTLPVPVFDDNLKKGSAKTMESEDLPSVSGRNLMETAMKAASEAIERIRRARSYMSFVGFGCKRSKSYQF